MGVKVRKRNGKWYVVIDYRGRRKSKMVGTREAAEKVKREIEARLAFGDFGIFSEQEAPTFRQYSEQWFQTRVIAELKPSTAAGYRSLLDSRLLPKLGNLRLPEITRRAAKDFLAEMVATDTLRRNTIRNSMACLRAILQHAVEDEILENNPASGLGRFNKPSTEEHRADYLTREEAQTFLETAKGFCPEMYPLFLAALRTGLREGELLGLQWSDVQFGEGPEDSRRHILLRRNYTHGRFTTPKSGKVRKVDLNRELRQVLIEWRDQLTIRAFERWQTEIPEFVFTSESGGPLDASNVYHRFFRPCLEAAGLRPVSFHALRHSFASHLVQAGASLLYVKEQLGHSSIRVTADLYAHLLPSANIAWIDALSAPTTPQQSATQAQPAQEEEIEESKKVLENVGAGEGNRTPDLRFTKPLLYRLSYAGPHR